MLIAGRAIAGIGGAGLMTGNINIIAACAPVDKRPVYMGTAMGLSGVGLVLGPVSYGFSFRRLASYTIFNRYTNAVFLDIGWDFYGICIVEVV
jgi:MFS family permease